MIGVLNLPGGAILSVRGLNLPSLHFGGGALLMGIGLVVSLLFAPWLWRHPRPPTHLRLAALLLPMGWLALLALSISSIEVPVLRGFNYSGGIVVPPELLAVVAGLSL